MDLANFRVITNTNDRYQINDNGNVFDTVKQRYVSQFNHRDGYKCVMLLMACEKRHNHTIHRLVAAAFLPDYDANKQVDHRDNNRINNNIANLRMVTNSQNQMNQQKTKKQTTSSYKGVDFDKSCKKYRAKIQRNGVKTFLGYFVSEIEAAQAYNAAALQHFGQYACLNVIN